MKRAVYREPPMTTRRALALGLMAINHVAGVEPDVRDWTQAAGVLRSMLSEQRAKEGDKVGRAITVPTRRNKSRRAGVE
jgi:hypothetical protein